MPLGWWLLGWWLLALGGCGGVPYIDVQLIGLPADAVRIEVTAELDLTSALEGAQSVTPALDRLRLQLAGESTGVLKLHVSAVDRSSCEIAAGDGSTRLRGAPSESVELQLWPKDGCRIDVEFVGPPNGVVQVGQDGPLCGENCQSAARRGELLSLSFTPSPGFILGGWFAPNEQPDCSGRGRCDLLVANGVTKVRVTTLKAQSCAASSWCREEDTPQLTSALYGIWGASRESIWAVGDGGTLLHSDGFVWSSTPPVTTRALRAIWGSGPTNIWAVGELGTMLHHDGRSWSVQPRVTTSWLLAIAGSGANDIWAVGEGGVILHGDGTKWTQLDAGITTSLRGVWSSGPNATWAVGDAGTILYFNGAAFSAVPSNTSLNLYGVAGLDAQNVWVVGDFGTALRLGATGMSPTPMATGISASLRSVFMPSSCANGAGCTGWAAGVGGVMVPLSATTTLAQPVASSFDPAGVINALWGSSSRDIWAVGQGATIVRYRPQ